MLFFWRGRKCLYFFGTSPLGLLAGWLAGKETDHPCLSRRLQAPAPDQARISSVTTSASACAPQATSPTVQSS